jgi:hypothetical protein
MLLLFDLIGFSAVVAAVAYGLWLRRASPQNEAN